MELRVGDIVVPRHKQLSPNVETRPSLYKIISFREDGIIPNVIIRVDEEGNPTTDSKTRDHWLDWHNYTWTLYKAKKIIPLTEADKKYEKIILKIRKLDHKFQTRKESK